MPDQNFRVEPGLEVGVGGTILVVSPNGYVGFGSTSPTSSIDSVGDARIVGVVTASKVLSRLEGDVFGNINSGVSTITNLSGVALTFTSLNSTNLTSSSASITKLSGTDLNYSGIATAQNLVVSQGFNVYSTEAVFHNDVTVSGNLSIAGTSFALTASELQVADKNITLGLSTATNPSDTSSNHGGIAIASTEGTPLVNLTTVGLNTFPITYKQILWVRSNTMGAGTTDAFLLNYGVGIGSTLVPTGTVLAAGRVQIAKDGTITSDKNVVGTSVTVSNSGINVSGIVTATKLSNARLENYGETINNIGNTGTAATIDLSNGNYVTATLTGNCTFTFTTGIQSGAVSFTLFLRNDSTAGRSIIWPSSVKWPNASVPVRTTSANKADVYAFFTDDGGTNWYGSLSIYNYS